jgi:aldehyde dehydrogenase (NAD+)
MVSWIGKPYIHALTIDIPMVVNTFRYYGGWADKIQGDVIETNPKKLTYTIREPIGVCGQIIPYILPLHIVNLSECLRKLTDGTFHW